MSALTDLRGLEALVRERIDRWWAGEAPDAAAVLAKHPDLARSKAMVLDLAQAEFSIRAAAGETISRSQFCERFPAYRQSIANMVEVEEFFLDKCPPDAMADGRVPWPAPGDEFLGFEIVESLGVGALARVFLAREPAVGDRMVVIKISPYGTREAKTLGKLSHPSIVQIHSTVRDEVDGWMLICMPLAGVATAVDLLDAANAAESQRDGKAARRDGALVVRTARETLRLEKLPALEGPTEHFDWNLTYPEAVARIGLQLAEALAAAHAAGIQHRDIKPSNILLAWSGRPMLLDFNLSADAAAGQQAPAGTLAYMAPEMIASLVKEGGDAELPFDPRGDIYSLGAVLYELLTGRLPCKPDDAEQLPLNAYEEWLECKRKKPALNLVGGAHPTDAEIDSRLSAIVLKCLAFDPAGRYESAAELAAELRGYLGGGARLGRFVKRRRREVVLAGLALIGIGAGLAAYIGNRPTPLELAYRQGLEQYEAGRFEEAVASFTKCLELKPGWPHALFGRGQAQRRMQKWPEARTDYTALRGADRAWSNALAGYCSMRMNDDWEAWLGHSGAYQDGLRHIGFLLNYARAQSNRQMHTDAVKTYSDVLSIDSRHKVALRNRALAYVAVVRNNQESLDPQAIVDVRQYCEVVSEGFEAQFCAAIVYGEAARKNSTYEQEAATYLTEALSKGMPLEATSAYPVQLKRLLRLVEPKVVAAARHDHTYRPDFISLREPPETADWGSFQREFGLQKSLLARTR